MVKIKNTFHVRELSFFKNRVVCLSDNVEKCCSTGQATDDMANTFDTQVN